MSGRMMNDRRPDRAARTAAIVAAWCCVAVVASGVKANAGYQTAVDDRGIVILEAGPFAKSSKSVKSAKSAKSAKKEKCFEAKMKPTNASKSNDGTFYYPSIEGRVKICFDETLQLNPSYPTTTAGVLTLTAEGLINGTIQAPSPGGIHIHIGPNCTTFANQGGHFFKNCTGNANATGRLMDCDPWYNNVDSNIAPTGTMYSVSKKGKGGANYKFDQGYGYNQTVGKVVVMHLGINATDYSPIRIACGELVPI